LTGTGIITALRSEAICLTPAKPEPGVASRLAEQLFVVLSGMGANNVNAAINTLLVQKVERLISFGTAAALRQDIKSGDIIIPANIVNAGNDRQDISSSWRDYVIAQLDSCPAKLHYGDMLGTDNVITNYAEKQALAGKTGAIAVDMESALICKAATEHKLSALVVRVVVDEADTSIPIQILDNTDAYGEVAMAGLLKAILIHPSLLKDLVKLGAAFKTARKSMQWLGTNAEKLFLSN
jgi:nucleoside phosphorylase